MKKLSLILLALLLCLSTACAQTLPAKDPAGYLGTFRCPYGGTHRRAYRRTDC